MNEYRITIIGLLKFTSWSVRTIARRMGITVPDVHRIMGCQDEKECTGKRCQVNVRES